MSRVTQADWDRYENLMNVNVHEDMAQFDVVWRRSTDRTTDEWQEDNPTDSFTEVTLKCLVQFNDFRKWPSDDTKTTGKSDSQTAFIFINKQYLIDSGYINASGYFDFNPGADEFAFEGITYKAFGDTNVAQTNTKNLWVTLTVRRVSPETGRPYHQE